MFGPTFTSGCDLLVIAVIYALSGSKLTYISLGHYNDTHVRNYMKLIMNLLKISSLQT